MVGSEFSEFQFAYGVTREMEAGDWLLPPLGIPTFPTQFEEGNLGFDALFGDVQAPGVAAVPVQFKRSDLLTTNWANEWEMFGGPYFRFPVYPFQKSPQHNLLVNLGKHLPFTCYVAPGFIHRHVYHGLHSARRLSHHSLFLPCGNLSRVWGREEHSVCYTMKPPRAYWCSEPVEVEGYRGASELLEWCRTQSDQFAPLSEVLPQIQFAIEQSIRAVEWGQDDFGALISAISHLEEVESDRERLVLSEHILRSHFSASLGFLRARPVGDGEQTGA